MFSVVSAKCSIYYFFIQTISVQRFVQDKSLRQKYPLITCLSCNGHIMATPSPLFFFFFLGSMPSAKPENLVILIMKKKHVLLKTSLLNILSCCFSVTAELLLHFSNVNEFSEAGGDTLYIFHSNF